MAEQLYARVSNLHATASEWSQIHGQFKPDAGELVIYDSDAAAKPPKIKIGNGTTLLRDLPFISLGSTEADDTTIFSVYPKAEIKITTSPSSNSFEVGTPVNCSASWVTNAGTYKHGTYANGTANFNDKTTGIKYTEPTPSTFTSKNVTIAEGPNTIEFSGTIKRSAIEKHPCSKLGEDLYNSLDIKYKSAQTLTIPADTTITGFRYAFGGTTDNDSLTSSDIRNENNKKSKREDMQSESKSFKITALKGKKKVFFAYPQSWGSTPKFQMYSLGWMNETFKQVESVEVAGASGALDTYKAYYNVYMWTSLEPLLADTEFRMWIE